MRTRTIKTEVRDAFNMAELELLIRERVGAPPHARVQIFTYAYEGGRNDLTADGDVKFVVEWEQAAAPEEVSS